MAARRDDDDDVVVFPGKHARSDGDEDDEPARKRARCDTDMDPMREVLLGAKSYADLPQDTLPWVVEKKQWSDVAAHMIRIGGKLADPMLDRVAALAKSFHEWRQVLAIIRRPNLSDDISINTAVAVLEALLSNNLDDEAAALVDAMTYSVTARKVSCGGKALDSVRKMLQSAPHTVKSLAYHHKDALAHVLLRASKLLSGKVVTAGGRKLASALRLPELDELVDAASISSAYTGIIAEPTPGEVRHVIVDAARTRRSTGLERVARVLARLKPGVFADASWVRELLRTIFIGYTRFTDECLAALAGVCSVPSTDVTADVVFSVLSALPEACASTRGVQTVLRCLGASPTSPTVIGAALWAFVRLQRRGFLGQNGVAHFFGAVAVRGVAPDFTMPHGANDRDVLELWHALAPPHVWADHAVWCLAHGTGIDWSRDVGGRLIRERAPPLLRFRLAMMEAERGVKCGDAAADKCPAIKLAMLIGEQRAVVAASNVIAAADGLNLALIVMRGVVAQDTALRRRIQHNHVLATAAANPTVWYAPLCANDGAAFDDFDADSL